MQETDSSYVTVKLEHQIQLTGTKFAVMIKYINKKENVKISVETKMNEFEPYIYCSSNAGESYYYTRDQGFIDMKKINSLQDANACIKAFTSFSGENVATNITSDKYKISDENKIIYEILPDTDIGELKNNINCNKNYNILDKQKNNITDTSTTISTGHSLITESYETYDLIVKGDLNGDGKLTGTDILKAKRYWAEIENLSEYEFIACDINEDNDITGTDILNMLKYYCDKITW